MVTNTLSIYRYFDYDVAFVARDLNGNVLNLSGYSVSGQVKQYHNSTESYLISCVVGHSGDYLNCLVSGSIPSSVTSNFINGRMIYQFDATGYGNRRLLAKGNVNIYPTLD